MVLVLTGLAPAGGVPAPEHPPTRVPLAAGVDYLRIERTGTLVADVAHVAPGAAAEVRVVLSQDRVFGDGEGTAHEVTSSMCGRAGALVCVNGDFAACPTCSSPAGGVVIDGGLLRTPRDDHQQLSVLGPGLSSVPLTARTYLAAVYEADPPPVIGLIDPEVGQPERREVAVDGVNVFRPPDSIILYTADHGPSTKTLEAGTEVVLRGPRPTIGAEVGVELVEIREGVTDTPIPADGFVASGLGSGAERLRAFWTDFADHDPDRRRAGVGVDASLDVRHSVGGHPVLLREGRPVPLDGVDPMVRNRHPRTLFGWNGAGAVWMVTIDGRQPGHSRGVTLPEAARLLADLGATEGLNLDGGGSSTFVAAGFCGGPEPCVVNRPSAGRERLVSTAVALVVPEAEPAAIAARVAERDPAPVEEASDPLPPDELWLADDDAEPSPSVAVAEAAEPPPPPPLEATATTARAEPTPSPLPGPVVLADPGPAPAPPTPDRRAPVAAALCAAAAAAAGTEAVRRRRPRTPA